jgi:thiosulfate/3-mercaptopyruvate sulfurtransferase
MSTHETALVSTDWLMKHLNDPTVRIVEVSVDSKLFAAGHIPGAVDLNWNTQLQHQVHRDIPTREAFEKLMRDAGIRSQDTVVIYGDHSNWFAAYGFWLFTIFGHKNVKLLNGGRAKWLSEENRPLTTETKTWPPSDYKAQEPDLSHRARVMDVLKASESRSVNLVDVRSGDEYSGKVIAPPGMTETAQRGGHVPGAVNVPWSKAVREDGTFKNEDELRQIYVDQAGVKPERPTIAYCRIGERSSHTWFVLKHLLGLPDVRNYDGSWTEYGSMIGVPIEK